MTENPEPGAEPGPQLGLGKVVLISLEPWDDVWRRNQHLAARLASLGLADHVTFVNPGRRAARGPTEPVPGVTVVSPRLRLPKRLGGLRVAAAGLSARFTRRCDTLWINDPTTGAHLSGPDNVVYDVTDDWRSTALTPRERRRLVAAEDALATRARTVVCSEELQRRWKARYRVDAAIVHNAADVDAIRRAGPLDLGGGGPHVGYVGTLHDERLDVDLVLKTAEALGRGLVHLVGPDSLTESSRRRLLASSRILVHGRVGAREVPSWLVAFDVLISPHVVSDFTRSLDAIKAYEYLASERPVVATPTSGFQDMEAAGLFVESEGFVEAVKRAADEHERFQRKVPDWDDRARQFAAALRGPDGHG